MSEEIKKSMAIGTASTKEQSSFISTIFARIYPDLSTEIDEHNKISASHFIEVDFKESRVGPKACHNFIRAFIPDAQKMFTSKDSNIPKGAPISLIITVSAERGEQIHSGLIPWHVIVNIPKLWASKIKIKEQIQTLKTIQPNLAIGTPNRVEKLISEGALNTSRIKYLIIDASFRLKEKNLSVIDQFDTQLDLFKIIKHFHSSILEGKVKLVLF